MSKIKILFTIPNFNTAGSGKVVYDLVNNIDSNNLPTAALDHTASPLEGEEKDAVFEVRLGGKIESADVTNTAFFIDDQCLNLPVSPLDFSTITSPSTFSKYEWFLDGNFISSSIRPKLTPLKSNLPRG